MYRDLNQEETEKSELSWGLENGRAGLDTSRWFWKPLQVMAVSWQGRGARSERRNVERGGEALRMRRRMRPPRRLLLEALHPES